MEKAGHFLPITRKEMDYLGWEEADVILISGDAYVDHSSFGTAIIGRILEKEGVRVAILPQPNWKDDLRDFKKLGRPRLFFGITAGNMDSMVNHYTANRRIRSNDAYTPGGHAGFRPDYATVKYTSIVKRLFPDVPVILGGIEASMRRLSHYDYWSDSLKPSVLIESGADILVYGMGEKPIRELLTVFKHGRSENSYKSIPQIAFVESDVEDYRNRPDVLFLHRYESELKNKKLYGENFIVFEEESNKTDGKILIQPYGDKYLVVNPPFPPPTEAEMDEWALFDRMKNAPHPKYAKRGDIPAFEMIKNSITLHRGCFGGCSFCTISAHQGKTISSRSEESILREVADLKARPYFKGHITDLGGPSANMYKMRSYDKSKCASCRRASCLFPSICSNMNIDHRPLTALYEKVRKMENVKKVTIGSGIRYEMLITGDNRKERDYGLTDYLKNLVTHHVSGRLKIAPEHISSGVTGRMRKPGFDKYVEFLKQFEKWNERTGKNQQLIPYFMSAHPGCTVEDMAQLSEKARQYRLMTDQVQEFTPTPMTYSTAMYYLGYDPYTGKKIPIAVNDTERKEQHLFFFYRKKENRSLLSHILRRNGLSEYIKKIFF